MKSSSVVLAAAIALGVSSAASAQIGPNLLNNAGFEDPLGFDFSNPLNWNGFFGGPGGTFLQAFNDTGATPLTGNAALVTTIRGVSGVTTGLNAFTGHVQRINTITPGLEYEFSIWARTNPLVTNGAEFKIEWFDSTNTLITSSLVPLQGVLTSTYTQFSQTSVAPSNVAYAQVVVAVQSFINTQPSADTSVAWDDAVFRTIPAPGSALLLAFGGVLASRRRR